MSFCSAAEPVGGILTSTWTLPSCSYLRTPAAATFQNSPTPFVTNANFNTLPAGAAAAAAGLEPVGAGASFLEHAASDRAAVALHQSRKERLEGCIRRSPRSSEGERTF